MYRQHYHFYNYNDASGCLSDLGIPDHMALFFLFPKPSQKVYNNLKNICLYSDENMQLFKKKINEIQWCTDKNSSSNTNFDNFMGSF